MRLRLVLRAIVPVEKAKKRWMNSGLDSNSLTSREREIMIQATAGQLNKQIAHGIGITESTVKVHRANLMRKMKARSLPELSRMADRLGLAQEKPQLP